MVHNFDACSKLWRDDPVRAALEKKQRAEASAQQRAESSAKMAALLQRKLNEKAGTDLGMGGPSGSEVDDEANYRRVRACPPRAQRTTSHHLTLAGVPGPRAAAEAATRRAQQRQRLVREFRVRSVREQVRMQFPLRARSIAGARVAARVLGVRAPRALTMQNLRRRLKREEKRERKAREREQGKREKKEKKSRKEKKKRKDKKDKKEKREKREKKRRKHGEGRAASASASSDSD